MLNHESISKRINKQLKSIGIEPEVNGEPSNTADLVSIIVKEIIRSIQRDAEIRTSVNTIVNTQGISSTPGTPEVHSGQGNGWGKGKVY